MSAGPTFGGAECRSFRGKILRIHIRIGRCERRATRPSGRNRWTSGWLLDAVAPGRGRLRRAHSAELDQVALFELRGHLQRANYRAAGQCGEG